MSTLLQTNRETDLREELRNLTDLPTLPEAADYHLSLVAREGYGLRDIKRMILLDPPLSATILREASLHRPKGVQAPHTIEEALMLLPGEVVRRLCAHQQRLHTFAPWNEIDLHSGILWRHAVGTGILAKALHLRKRMNHRHATDPYLAGLLHHIGWFVLDALRPVHVRRAVQRFRDTGHWSLDDEREIFGMDHAEIGAQLLENWGLEDGLVQAIRFHHKPGRAGKHSGSAALIQVASVLSPHPFPLATPIQKVETSLPNRLRYREGPHLLAEMRDRYGRYINQAMHGSQLMISWL